MAALGQSYCDPRAHCWVFKAESHVNNILFFFFSIGYTLDDQPQGTICHGVMQRPKFEFPHMS